MNEDQRTQSTSSGPDKPSRPTRWALLFPIALLAIVVLLNLRKPDPQNTPAPDIDSATITADNAASTNSAEPSATKTPKPQRQYSVPTQIWVPGDDAMLHAKPFNDGYTPNGHRDALNAIIKAAPDLFPKGARILSLKQQGVSAKDGHLEISVNRAFADDNFWNKSEKVTQLAVYALVNQVARQNEPKGKELPVQIVIEGKRGNVLGQFDISEPIEANWDLVAKS